MLRGTHALAPDIQAELDKLLAADLLLLQFPMWWFSMPAILERLDRPRVRFWCGLRFRPHLGQWRVCGPACDVVVYVERARSGVSCRMAAMATWSGCCGRCMRAFWRWWGTRCCRRLSPTAFPLLARRPCKRKLRALPKPVAAGSRRDEPLFFPSRRGYSGTIGWCQEGVEPATPGQHRGARKHLPDNNCRMSCSCLHPQQFL